MTSPYFLMSFLYLLLAVLAALDSAFTSFNLVPWFNGLRWLRVHFITLGVLTQVLFGLLPGLVAIRRGLKRPAFRWDTWALVNVGFIALLIGMPLLNVYVILIGGTLVFAAVIQLALQLYGMRKEAGPAAREMTGSGGTKFYLMGLMYFLLGIIIGTGLWLGWSNLLRIKTPIEVHIHANNWGLMSLVFAGLLVDLYPRFSGRELARPGAVTKIFWMMSFGALGLVLGPWFGLVYLTVPGMLLHLAATFMLLYNVIRPMWQERKTWPAGFLHLVVSYFWILAPVLVAPLIILGVPGFPGAGIEQNAPQALIYGWVLQFGYALLPFLFRRAFQPDAPAKLGGNTFSLVTVNLGGAFLWASIFIEPLYGLLHGTAYVLWALSMLPIAADIWQTVREGLSKLEAVAQH